MIRLKRIYDPPANADGYRVLVDGLWPRGVRKADAKVDVWAREVAPSPQLRKWFSHDPAKWPEFKRRYQKELLQNDALAKLQSELKKRKRVTLLYGAKDDEHNNAAALLQTLQSTE